MYFTFLTFTVCIYLNTIGVLQFELYFKFSLKLNNYIPDHYHIWYTCIRVASCSMDRAVDYEPKGKLFDSQPSQATCWRQDTETL